MRSRSDRKRFEYKPRTAGDMKKRADQSGGAYDTIFKSSFNTIKLKEDSYVFRIMPPTWEGAEHYGLDVYVHYGVGADEGQYLCLEKNAAIMKELGLPEEKCPVCEERRQAQKDGDLEYANKLNPAKRVVCWVIDRDDEDSGPFIWAMPWTIDRDLAALAVDKRTGEVLCLDSPEDGYDVEFERKGKKMNVKYIGLQIARKSTTLGADERDEEEWLDFIQQNPIPETLNFFDAEHIAKVFGGAVASDSRGERRSKADRDREDLEKQADEVFGGRRRRGKDDEEEDPRASRRRRDKDEDPEEEEKPRSRRRDRDEPEEEEKPRSRRRDRDKDEEPEEEPRRRGRRDEPEEEEEPRSRRRRDKDEDEEEKPRSRRRDKEEEPGEPVEDENEPPRRRRERIRGKGD